MPTKHIWRQEDREDAPTQARRLLIGTEAALTAMWDIYDARLERVCAQGPALLQRALRPLSDVLNGARILAEAYDYALNRCVEAGLTPDQAHAAWEEWSTPDFEAELVEAESYGPNAIPMIDQQILARLGIAPCPTCEDGHDEHNEHDE